MMANMILEHAERPLLVLVLLFLFVLLLSLPPPLPSLIAPPLVLIPDELGRGFLRLLVPVGRHVERLLETDRVRQRCLRALAKI